MIALNKNKCIRKIFVLVSMPMNFILKGRQYAKEIKEFIVCMELVDLKKKNQKCTMSNLAHWNHPSFLFVVLSASDRQSRLTGNLFHIISWPTAYFSTAPILRLRGELYSFLWIAPFTFDSFLIIPSVKQGGIKYHFCSLWYDLTKNKLWSPGPLANTFYWYAIIVNMVLFDIPLTLKKSLCICDCIWN